MVTSINNYQSNLNFNASMKVPKLKAGKDYASRVSNTTSKIKDFGKKIKDEFKNMDEETAKYIFDSTVILAALTGVFFAVKGVIDKFATLFE